MIQGSRVMKNSSLLIPIFFCLYSGFVLASEEVDPRDTVVPRGADSDLMDPMERDESIHMSEVEVEVTENDDGLYEYTYRVVSGIENKGFINIFEIDLSCDFDFPEYQLPAPLEGERNLGIADKGVAITPAVIRFETPRTHGIARDGVAFWGVGLQPGDEIDGIRILSPVEPGMREFRFEPYIETIGYDYDSLTDEEYEQAPWKEDFEVTGMIEGPACPGVSPPPESPRYPGSTFGPAHINELLTYSEPLRNRLRVDEDQSSVTVTIHFDERIDPDTFRVQPAWARRHFDAPRPGGSQTVEVPLRGPRTQLQFEVHPRKSDQPRDEDPYHHSFKDMDVFEIRQGDMKAPPGRERDPQQGGNRNE